VKFLIDNWLLILVALTSAAMLFWPLLRSAGGSGLNPNAAVHLINRDKAVVVDVGDDAEFAAGHVVGARHVPLAQLEARLPEVARNKSAPLLLVCASGGRAQRAQGLARKLGYENAQVLAGGLRAWKEANLPLEKA
jgi:rhodanese-related sulfurtransferase